MIKGFLPKRIQLTQQRVLSLSCVLLEDYNENGMEWPTSRVL